VPPTYYDCHRACAASPATSLLIISPQRILAPEDLLRPQKFYISIWRIRPAARCGGRNETLLLPSSLWFYGKYPLHAAVSTTGPKMSHPVTIAGRSLALPELGSQGRQAARGLIPGMAFYTVPRSIRPEDVAGASPPIPCPPPTTTPTSTEAYAGVLPVCHQLLAAGLHAWCKGVLRSSNQRGRKNLVVLLTGMFSFRSGKAEYPVTRV
jgi:hypothetical protein